SQVFDVQRRELAGDRIDFLGEADAAERAPLVWSGMRPALKLREAPFGIVVAVGLHAARIVEWNTLVVAERWTAGSLIRIFGDPVDPFPGKIGLGKRWRGEQYRGQEAQQAGKPCSPGVIIAIHTTFPLARLCLAERHPRSLGL